MSIDAQLLVERMALKAFVEACLVLEEGIAPLKDIDLGMMAAAGINPPPFQRADADGLDVMLERLEAATERWGEAFTPPTVLRRLVAQGRLGRSSGQGFYPYPQPDEGWTERPVQLETRNEVAIAWLARPPANSISPELGDALRDAWETAVSSGARAVIVASANPMLFCAGADIKAFSKMEAGDGGELAASMHALLREFERSSVVTIAAVNGTALGGGCELAMACDLRLAATSASFGQPEIKLGIIPGFGGTQRLPRLVGESAALELNLTGEPIDAERAYELGLVNRVVEDHDLFDEAIRWAFALADRAPRAIEHIKRVSAAGDLDAGLAAEQQAFAEVFATEDAREGIGAFLGKRAPRFTGR
jgi:enoyl-CoA hydratase/3-hydroxyacyl-CoA dehydrogenase